MGDSCRVLWFDPGGTTGAAWATLIRDRVVESVKAGLEDGTAGVCQIPVGCGEPNESRGAWAMMELVAEMEPDVVGLEDFRLVPNERHSPKQDGTIPMRLNAKIDMLWWMAQQPELGLSDHELMPGESDSMPKLVKQMPGERTVMTDAKLRAWGLWRTEKRGGGGLHAMDALRHLLVFGRKGKW